MNRAILTLALRQLQASPRSVAFTVFGVALGVSVFIFTVAMMDGLLVFFSQRILRISPTLTVRPEQLAQKRELFSTASGRPQIVTLSRSPVPAERPTIKGSTGVISRLEKTPAVFGIAPMASCAAVLNFGTSQEGANLLGVEPEAETTVTELHQLLSQGSWHAFKGTRSGTVLGVQLAQRLGVEIGDRIVVTGEAGGQKELQVVGILSVGIGAWDESTALVPLSVAQALAGWGNDEVSEIRVRTGLHGLEELRQLVQDVTGYRTERWEETNRSALQLFRTIGLTTYLLTGFVLIVAGLGVGNKVATVILDKERDIAILRAYGFTPGAVRGIFLVQGLVLGLSGVLVGCAFAWGVVSYFQAFPIRFAPRQGGPLAYTELYLSNDPRYYLIVSLVSLGLALMASLLAVRRANKVLPVEVLRGQV